MVVLNESYACEVAKELTITALENNMITPSDSAKTTAEEIALFYRTLVDCLSTETT